MDLRITIALLFLLIAGGHSLECYSCTSILTGVCKEKETCADGSTKCSTLTVTNPVATLTTKSCATPASCAAGSTDVIVGTATLTCCDTNLCNGADGVFKGSFLLLMCPLIVYTLFH